MTANQTDEVRLFCIEGRKCQKAYLKLNIIVRKCVLMCYYNNKRRQQITR